MKIKQLNEMLGRRSYRILDRHRRNLIRIAQEIYDEWDESDVDTYAGGGICHLIAEGMTEYLDRQQGIVSFTAPDTLEQHVYTVAIVEQLEEEGENMDDFFRIDITPQRYERGGGFSWCKIPGVVLNERDLVIDYLGTGHDWYKNFEVDWL